MILALQACTSILSRGMVFLGINEERLFELLLISIKSLIILEYHVSIASFIISRISGSVEEPDALRPYLRTVELIRLSKGPCLMNMFLSFFSRSLISNLLDLTGLLL